MDYTYNVFTEEKKGRNANDEVRLGEVFKI